MRAVRTEDEIGAYSLDDVLLSAMSEAALARPWTSAIRPADVIWALFENHAEALRPYWPEDDLFQRARSRAASAPMVKRAGAAMKRVRERAGRKGGYLRLRCMSRQTIAILDAVLSRRADGNEQIGRVSLEGFLERTVLAGVSGVSWLAVGLRFDLLRSSPAGR